MPSDFDKFLDGLDKVPAPEAAPEASKEAAPEAPAGPPDPYAHLIGHGGALVEQSPFDAMLDQMAESDEAKALPEEEPDYGNHEWKTIKDAIFEDDYYVWRCDRCLRQINVQRSETLAQACAKVNLNPNCGEQVAAEVMES